MAEPTPHVSAGFDWHTTPAGRVLSSSALATCADHLFSSRDASPVGVHDPDYDAIAMALGVDTSQVVRVRQVHGRHVLVVREGDDFDTRTEADAVVTTSPRLVVSVRVADCVPILIGDRQGRAVAAVHAGWRGTTSGVVVAAIDALTSLGVRPSDLVAAIGPSIGPCCYQVDAAVRDEFATRHARADDWFTPDGPDRWRLDLWNANQAQLEACGVPPPQIHHAATCTADALDVWYSHRRQGASAGRMIAAIRLKAG